MVTRAKDMRTTLSQLQKEPEIDRSKRYRQKRSKKGGGGAKIVRGGGVYKSFDQFFNPPSVMFFFKYLFLYIKIVITTQEQDLVARDVEDLARRTF